MRWRSLAALVSTVAVGMVGLSGCEEDEELCNKRAAYCALTIELEHAAWEPGSYVFEASDGQDVFRCSATLPDPDGSSWKCESHVLQRYFGDSGPSPSALELHAAPSETTVRVIYEGQEVASKTFHPQYEETEPHGVGCGICKNADAKLEF